jgi:hypothetical protein
MLLDQTMLIEITSDPLNVEPAVCDLLGSSCDVEWAMLIDRSINNPAQCTTIYLL